MKNIKKIIILMMCQLFFVLLGCGQVGGPCGDGIVLKVKSPDGVSIGSYSGEFLQNGKYIGSFYCDHDQALDRALLRDLNNLSAYSCYKENTHINFPAEYFSRNSMIASFDVVVYSFNKEMKSQTHFDLKFKYPQYHENEEGCEVKTIEVILQ